MPFRKTYRRPYRKTMKKRVYRRRGYKTANDQRLTITRAPAKLSIGQGHGPSERCRMKLKYTGNVQVQSGGVGITYGEYLFRVNSLFDPDLSGVGLQPTYFDTMSEMYARYLVYGVAYKVTFLCYTASAPVICGLFFQPGQTTPIYSNIIDATSSNDVNSRIISGLGAGQTIGVLKGYADMKTLAGVRVLDDVYQGTIGTNPPRSIFMNIFTGNPDGVLTPVTRAIVELTFYTEFSDLIQQKLS